METGVIETDSELAAVSSVRRRGTCTIFLLQCLPFRCNMLQEPMLPV